jgi:hypothetical protein
VANAPLIHLFLGVLASPLVKGRQERDFDLR